MAEGALHDRGCDRVCRASRCEYIFFPIPIVASTICAPLRRALLLARCSFHLARLLHRKSPCVLHTRIHGLAQKQKFDEAERTMPAPSALPAGNLAVAEIAQIQALLIKSDPYVDLREWEEDCEQLPGYLRRVQDARSKRAATHG